MVVVVLLLLCVSRAAALNMPTVRAPATTRRQAVVGAASLLGAEASWQLMCDHAAAAVTADSSLLPPGVIEQIEAGRVVTIPNWLPAAEVRALRADAEACYAAGHFKADALATYGQKKKSGFDPSQDRMVMPSFYPSKGPDGPGVDGSIGDAAARQQFKARMATLKASLSQQLEGRTTLAANAPQTHEMSYTRYGPGAFLPRHTDEHHSELKKPHPVASGDEKVKRLTANSATAVESSVSLDSGTGGGGEAGGRKPVTTRRSVTWLVYLNEAWQPGNGGELRVHERKAPSAARVGARGADLQIGWLRATGGHDEEPVFLDANRAGPNNCCLYACLADGSKRDLSKASFAASPALYLGGGDFFARKLLVDDPADQERFHLCDAPKSPASAMLPPPGDAGEDGGERVRDVAPRGGTLVLFDSVSIPHEVLATRGTERFSCSGWFHEKLLV
jgi:Rps23 Pro-64 3,4-dihydroxylase Tpa1-like proline 4-hydroxylase